MELRIGIVDSPRELLITTEDDHKQLRKRVVEVLQDGGAAVLTLQDEKGREYFVPRERIAYVDLGAAEARKVGFSA